MAVPKKKSSPSRRNMRRHSYKYKLDTVTLSTCPNCNGPRAGHSVCRCGFYAGKPVFTPRVRTKPTEAEQAR